jgi:hypothetical protein
VQDEQQNEHPQAPQNGQKQQSKPPKPQQNQQQQTQRQEDRAEKIAKQIDDIRRSSMVIETACREYDEQATVLSAFVRDHAKDVTARMDALEARVTAQTEAVLQSQQDTRQLLRMVAADPNGLAKLRKIQQRTEAKSTSLASRFTGPLVFGCAVLAFAIVFAVVFRL